VYARNVPSEAEERTLLWVDRNGRENSLAAPPANYRHPRLSPDGERLALNANGTVVVWDMDRPWSAAVRLPTAPTQNRLGPDGFPVWTPDGRRLVFGSWRGGGLSNVYWQEPGSPDAERLTESPDMQLPTSITPDGMTVIFHSFTKRLEALRLDGQGAARQRVLVETPREERNGVLSADGRWLAYEAESAVEPGQMDVYVRPFPNVNAGLWQVTTAGGAYPAWRRDGRELFYHKPDGTLVAIPVETSGVTWHSGEPKDLFRGAYFWQGDGSLGRQYDPAADGQRFLMIKNVRAAGASKPPHFVLVQNWAGELPKLAATK
jgi:Tol biopolymer transport system component